MTLYSMSTVCSTSITTYVTDCLNATDGSVVWKLCNLAMETVAPGISYAYQRLYFVNQNRVLYVLDAQTGANFIL